jgi:hypothetical protein
MPLESLANEFLFDFLENLIDNDVFCTFYRLNHDFDTLLLGHIHVYYLNFQSIFRKEFDLIWNKNFPVISHRMI